MEIELEILACSLNQLRHHVYPIPHYKGTSLFYTPIIPSPLKIKWSFHLHKS